MKSIYLLVTLILASADLVFAQPASRSPARDIWEVVFARDSAGRDQQIGYSHVSLVPESVDGKKIIRGTRELRLSIKRGGQTAQIKGDTGTEETEDGKVSGVFMKQWLGEQQSLLMRGLIDEKGESISINVDSNVKKNSFKNPWDSRVIGISGELSLFKDKPMKPGDSFSYRFFEPTLSSVVTINVNVKKLEEVLLPRGGKKELIRIESKPEKIQEVQLPSSTIWVDPELKEPVLTQTEMPGFGLLTLQRSTKAVATGVLGQVPDLMKQQTIRLGQRIAEDMSGLHEIVYGVTFKGKDSNAATLIKEDDRQTIKNLHDNSFDLHVVSRRAPRKVEKEVAAAAEFLESNHFINSNDENVKKLAVRAVGKLVEPWEKAKAIERWVKANMRSVNYAEAMATSDHVAKTLSGDCTEYSMLTAAMCRAQGIPSRTAIGLVYVDHVLEPSLAFHMWTEVFVKGQWLSLDATRGKGAIGPGHIKITDHSWHDVLDFKPLLPVTGFLMAKPSFQIKEAIREP